MVMPPPTPSPIQSLRTFYALLSTQMLSLIGSRMSGIAVGIWLFETTGNTAPLLIAAFFAELPGMLLGSFTGMLADRWPRRRVIVLGDVGQALGSCLLLGLLLTGRFELWQLYLLVLMQGIFSTLQSPASEATITMLVPEAHRDRANGLQQVGFPLAGVVAPVFATFIYKLAGLEAVMLADLLSFGVAVAVISRLHIPQPRPSVEGTASKSSFRAEMLGGWAFLVRRRVLLLMIVYLSFIFFLINGPLDLAIPYVMTLMGSDLQLGLFLAMMNGGALAGALTAAAVGRFERRIPAILLCYLLLGLMMMAYGMVRQPLLLGLTVFLVFFPLPLAGALFNSILQSKTPPDMQGRVFAVTGQLFMLATPFSFLLTGWLVDDVLEPAVNSPGWATVAPLVGREPGAGMGLLLLGVGLLIVLATGLAAALQSVRELESRLPSYLAEAEA